MENQKLTEERKQSLIAATLKWCNSMRRKRGKEPLKKLPKGRRWNGASCPCGKATGVFVARSGWSENKHDATWGVGISGKIPSKVSEFVAHFDEGRIPEYALPANEIERMEKCYGN